MKEKRFKNILNAIWREGAARLFLFALILWTASITLAQFRFYYYVQNGDPHGPVSTVLKFMTNLFFLGGIIHLIFALLSLYGVELPFLAKWLRTQRNPDSAQH